MDYAALHDEIALPVYAGMSDAEVAAALNAKTVEGWQMVDCRDAKGVLIEADLWVPLKDSAHPAARTLVEALTQVSNVHLERPQTRAKVIAASDNADEVYTAAGTITLTSTALDLNLTE